MDYMENCQLNGDQVNHPNHYNDNIIEVYDSIKEAARKNNAADANIHAVLKGKQHKCAGFKWKKV